MVFYITTIKSCHSNAATLRLISYVEFRVVAVVVMACFSHKKPDAIFGVTFFCSVCVL